MANFAKKYAKKKKQTQKIGMTDYQIHKAIVVNEASKRAFLTMMGVSLIALRDKFGFGPERMKRFSDKVFLEYSRVQRGLLTFEDMHNVVKEETGIDVNDWGII